MSSTRFDVAIEKMERRGLLGRSNIVQMEPEPVSMRILRLFHIDEHIEYVKIMSILGKGYLDYGDTPAYKGVFEDALLVVGASVKGAEMI